MKNERHAGLNHRMLRFNDQNTLLLGTDYLVLRTRRRNGINPPPKKQNSCREGVKLCTPSDCNTRTSGHPPFWFALPILRGQILFSGLARRILLPNPREGDSRKR